MHIAALSAIVFKMNMHLSKIEWSKILVQTKDCFSVCSLQRLMQQDLMKLVWANIF